IPVGNLLTDLDAHNIRFNGSGTNYLTAKTEVEGAVKELDTRVKTEANALDERIDNIIVTPMKTDFITLSSNLLNKDKVIKNKSIDTLGNIVDHTFYGITDYLPVV